MNKRLKALAILLAILAIVSPAFATPVIHTESFETDGEGSRYTSNAGISGNDYFERSTNPHPGHASPFVTGIDGSYLWASEDVDGSPNALGAGSVGIVRLMDIDVSAFSAASVPEILVTIGLAVSNDNGTRFENASSTHQDEILVQYGFDGNSGGVNLASGTYATIGRFAGTAEFGGPIRQDADLNGTADNAGASLSNAMSDFTFSIPNVGNALSLQIVVDTNGGSEEISFDHVRVAVPEPSSFLFLTLMGTVVGCIRYVSVRFCM